LKSGDLTHRPAQVLKPLLQQALLLARQYDAVVANPPYMGSKHFNNSLKEYIKENYKNAKADLCVAFIDRGMEFTNQSGLMSMITMQSWMFLSSFEDFRISLMQNNTMRTMIHLGPHAFPEIGGQVVQVAAFIVNPMKIAEYRGSYKRLIEGQSHEKESRFHTTKTFTPSNEDFAKIPGQTVAYQLSAKALKAFAENPQLHAIGNFKKGMNTGNNDIYLRMWTEVSFHSISLSLQDRKIAKWFPIQKGGPSRRWYGNQDFVVNWQNDGAALRAFPNAVLRNQQYYFCEGVTWTTLSSDRLNMRLNPDGFIFEGKGSAAFFNNRDDLLYVLGYCNSVVFKCLFSVISPTIDSESGSVGKAPFVRLYSKNVIEVVKEAIQISQQDWDDNEISWHFQSLRLLLNRRNNLKCSQEIKDTELLERLERMKELEEKNNRLFIEAYGLQDELSPEVPDDQITLYRPERLEDIKRLISYAIGCVMGRYSLDKPGLIYAHSGNQGFDPSQYATFRADDDGIIPLLDNDWGIRDDATNRIIEFIGVAWSSDNLEENLKFIADSLDPESKESARETIRHYLSTGFYKHHLSMYKKRPIYWLFSSGKQRAFQCLVYLHRYNEGTLSRMRTEYVIPLMGKLNGRFEKLEGVQKKGRNSEDIEGGNPEEKEGGDISSATGALKRNLEKERDTVKKKIAEIQLFDARLRHYADLRIKLDLDDGVKVNYGKFSEPDYGDILADVKAICGTKDED
jgi:type II restriction/modification system DNA methylase subunit YeeA